MRRALLLLLALSLAPPVKAQSPCAALGGVNDLPLVERSVRGSGDLFAVLVTGDGGWMRIDRKLADRLLEGGVPVVGFLSRYFGTRRTPEETACALERVIEHYSLQWARGHVILIGYSRGADVLPFMASRLSPVVKQKVSLIALLGLEPSIDFEYHPPWSPAAWFRHPPQYPVGPELDKLRGQRVLCVYGEDEPDSLCPGLDPHFFTLLREPGGHHFGGRYSEIGAEILRQAR